MEALEWLGHSGFKLKISGKTIYIDPFKINTAEPADLILITHDHYDHCSVEDIMKIATNNTLIFVTADSQSKLSNYPGKVLVVEPNGGYKLGDMVIRTIPAYNTNKMFHPKENGWVGYVIEHNGEKLYHAGDTDAIPEMKNLQNIDYALLPVSGEYVMNAEEAASAANMIRPKIAVPMHYNAIVGSVSDAERFKSLCKCQVKIMEKL
ncbi:MAG: MBL fold metallo-hydrolase [Candidatus Woesearchaeota archaeon]